MRKTPQLVSQFLETISGKILENYQAIIRRYGHRRQGVYALYRGDRLYYVGLASNLNARIKQHLRDRHKGKWDKFSVYLTIGDRHLKELESLVLRIAQPKGNKVAGKFAKAENLRRKLKRDIRASQQVELNVLVGRRVRKRVIKRVLRKSKRKPGPTRKSPVLADYFSQRVKLRAQWKGKTFRATVRKDGSIRFQGNVFRSPSNAARAAIGYAVNGWRFWTYEQAPGDWVFLNTRKK